MGDRTGLGIPGDTLGETAAPLAKARDEQQLAKLAARTIFLDIDGCILRVDGSNWFTTRDVLPGAQQKVQEWWDLGYRIILTTGRPECLRSLTEQNLRAHQIFYHQLVMDCGDGARVIINDLKPYASDPMAVAINVTRNAGLEGIKV